MYGSTLLLKLCEPGNRAVGCNVMPTPYSWLCWGTSGKSLLRILKPYNLNNPSALTRSPFSIHCQACSRWAGHAPGGSRVEHAALKHPHGLPRAAPARQGGQRNRTCDNGLGQTLPSPVFPYRFLASSYTTTCIKTSHTAPRRLPLRSILHSLTLSQKDSQ